MSRHENRNKRGPKPEIRGKEPNPLGILDIQVIGTIHSNKITDPVRLGIQESDIIAVEGGIQYKGKDLITYFAAKNKKSEQVPSVGELLREYRGAIKEQVEWIHSIATEVHGTGKKVINNVDSQLARGGQSSIESFRRFILEYPDKLYASYKLLSGGNIALLVKDYIVNLYEATASEVERENNIAFNFVHGLKGATKEVNNTRPTYNKSKAIRASAVFGASHAEGLSMAIRTELVRQFGDRILNTVTVNYQIDDHSSNQSAGFTNAAAVAMSRKIRNGEVNLVTEGQTKYVVGFEDNSDLIIGAIFEAIAATALGEAGIFGEKFLSLLRIYQQFSPEKKMAILQSDNFFSSLEHATASGQNETDESTRRSQPNDPDS